MFGRLKYGSVMRSDASAVSICPTSEREETGDEAHVYLRWGSDPRICRPKWLSVHPSRLGIP
jgi:hypothetical protein